MKLSVCIEMVFPGEWSIQQKILAVGQSELSGIEFWSWQNKDLEVLSQAVKANQLTIVAFCTRGTSLVDPGQRQNFLQGLEESLGVANRLGCDRLIAQAGMELAGIPRQKQAQSLVQGLAACVPLLERHNVTLLLEPLNILVDHKGYFLYNSQEAFELVGSVNSPKVKVLYDVYHQQITEGNLIPTIQKNIDLIGHFHVADHPGRHQPGTGEINYRQVLAAIKETGYDGWIGLEYRPTKSPLETLRQVRELTAGL